MESDERPRIIVHRERYAIHRYPPDAEWPPMDLQSPFYSVTRTPMEISVVTREDPTQAEQPCSPGWRALSLVGPLPFEWVGILARITRTLADAQVSIFAISTYDTDWFLVKAEALPRTLSALRAAGYAISGTHHG